MYTQFILFSIAYLLFLISDFQSGSPHLWVNGIINAAAALLFIFFVSAYGWRLTNRLRLFKFRHPLIIQKAFSRFTLFTSLASIGVFSLQILTMGLKPLITSMPFIGHLNCWQVSSSMILFTAYQAVIWNASYSLYTWGFSNTLQRKEYIGGNFRLIGQILLWFVLINTFFDILKYTGITEYLAGLVGFPVEFIIIILVMGILFSLFPALVKRTWGCTPMPDSPQTRALEALCKKAKMKYRRLLLWPLYGGKGLNAAVMGVIPYFRYILFTPLLLNRFTQEELNGVLGHEIGHVKHHHQLKYIIILLLFFTVNPFLSNMATQLWVFLFPHASAAAAYVEIISFVVFFYIFLRFIILGYFSRLFERQADAYSASLNGTAQPLIDAFEKMSIMGGKTKNKPSWHHFSIKQRIDFLHDIEKSPSLIRHHTKRVRRSLMIYTFILFMFIILGLFVGTIRQQTNQYDTNMPRLMQSESHYIKNNDYQHLTSLYSNALNENPSNSYILNNYAWMLLTAENETYRNPQQALHYAKRAILKNPDIPNYRDTLAEAYFQNRKIDEAVSNELKALEYTRALKYQLNTSLQKHLKKQLTKFKHARSD